MGPGSSSWTLNPANVSESLLQSELFSLVKRNAEIDTFVPTVIYFDAVNVSGMRKQW